MKDEGLYNLFELLVEMNDAAKASNIEKVNSLNKKFSGLYVAIFNNKERDKNLERLFDLARNNIIYINWDEIHSERYPREYFLDEGDHYLELIRERLFGPSM
ncbi:MAG: hypothetical protein QW727_02790 [Candidatus Pacearchaeota archaeon]